MSLLHLLIVAVLMMNHLSLIHCADLCNEKCAFCEDGRCRECIYGWYGHNCNSECQNCWTSGCHKHSGRCDQCKPGRYMDDCGTPCPVNCRTDRREDVYCRREDGKCLDGCKEGWWGEMCSQTCSGNCDGWSCLQNSGHCIGDCVNGWFGVACNKSCSVGCRNSKCELLSGKCLGECTMFRYGKYCTKECSMNCRDGECDMHGWCVRGCIGGFRGRACSEPCPFNCLTCDQYGDTCIGCKSEWSGRRCRLQKRTRSLENITQESVQGDENGGSRLTISYALEMILFLITNFVIYELVLHHCESRMRFGNLNTLSVAALLSNCKDWMSNKVTNISELVNEVRRNFSCILIHRFYLMSPQYLTKKSFQMSVTLQVKEYLYRILCFCAKQCLLNYPLYAELDYKVCLQTSRNYSTSLDDKTISEVLKRDIMYHWKLFHSIKF